ncbi:EKC/KEOPS complex subunit TPRKB isoform X1 [Hippoglossus hippoglossus]|uniref:EKC/KEOPS complex subunit TPRKB isoform X1 n=1 Tax=Hippoglossus hippoglossus TaxID=8267 RepID=UPI00148CC8D0|nr:EKC/KEOPS complex subunit TPRKB isoform X1 [Hippoglossus hippoglossus]
MHHTHELELFPDRTVTQVLFTEVKNAAELRQSAVDGQIIAALINPTMVGTVFSDDFIKRSRVTCWFFVCAYLLQSSVFFHLQLVDPLQVLVAANKAVHLQNTGKMKTRSLNSEMIFNLSPTNNISEAFKRFGISDGDDSVMVVIIHDKKNESQLVEDIVTKVDGRQVPVEDLSSLSDSAKIRKLYKVAPQEETCGTLLDAVICRMATKDVM